MTLSQYVARLGHDIAWRRLPVASTKDDLFVWAQLPSATLYLDNGGKGARGGCPNLGKSNALAPDPPRSCEAMPCHATAISARAAVQALRSHMAP